MSEKAPPMLKRRSNMPRVLWYQDPGKIVLRIMMADVKDYYLSVDYDYVCFSTIYNDKPYYLCIRLFGAVTPEKTVNENLGREIRVQLVKTHKYKSWLRLEESKEPTQQIAYDPDKIEQSQIKDEVLTPDRQWFDFQEYKQQNRLNIYPVCPDSDSEDSDDERYHLITDADDGW